MNPFLAVGEASGESAARTVSQLGRPRSATTARRVRTNSVVTLTPVTPSSAGDSVRGSPRRHGSGP